MLAVGRPIQLSTPDTGLSPVMAAEHDQKSKAVSMTETISSVPGDKSSSATMTVVSSAREVDPNRSTRRQRAPDGGYKFSEVSNVFQSRRCFCCYLLWFIYCFKHF